MESHDSNRTILNRSILASESPIQCHESERREWGVGSVVVGFGVLGCPDFPSRRPHAL